MRYRISNESFLCGALLLLVILSGCARYDPVQQQIYLQGLKQQEDVSMKKFTSCIRDRTVELMDNSTPVDSLTRIIIGNCEMHYRDFATARVKHATSQTSLGLNVIEERMLIDAKVHDDLRQWETPVSTLILKARKQQRHS